MQGWNAKECPHRYDGPCALDQSPLRVDSELAGQHDVAAAIHTTISNTYFTIGRYDEGEPQKRASEQTGRALNGYTDHCTEYAL